MAGGRVIGGNPMMDSFKAMNQTLGDALKLLQNQRQLQEMQRQFDVENRRMQGMNLWQAAAPTPEQMVMNARDGNPVMKESLKLMHGWDDETASRYMEGIASFNLLPEQQGKVMASRAYSLLQSGKPDVMRELSGMFGEVWNQKTVGLEYPDIIDRSGDIRNMAPGRPSGGQLSGNYADQMGPPKDQGQAGDQQANGQNQPQTYGLAVGQASKEEELQALERVQAQGKATPDVNARADQLRSEMGIQKQAQPKMSSFDRSSAYDYYQQQQAQTQQARKLTPEQTQKLQEIDAKMRTLAPNDPARKYLQQEKAFILSPEQSKVKNSFFFQVGDNLRSAIARGGEYTPDFLRFVEKGQANSLEAAKRAAAFVTPEDVEDAVIEDYIAKSPAKGRALGFGSVQEIKQALADGTFKDKIFENRNKARKAIANTPEGSVAVFVTEASEGKTPSDKVIRQANKEVEKTLREANIEQELLETIKELKKVDPTLLAMYFPDAAKRSDIEFRKDVTGKNLLLQEAQLKINDKIANTEQARLYLQAAAQAAQDAVVKEHPEYKFMFDLSEKAMLEMIKDVDITKKNAWKAAEENLRKGPASIAWTLYQKVAEEMGIKLNTVEGRRSLFGFLRGAAKPTYTTTEYLNSVANKAYAPVQGVRADFNADKALNNMGF